jgi:hypothetical protein
VGVKVKATEVALMCGRCGPTWRGGALFFESNVVVVQCDGDECGVVAVVGGIFL